MSSYIKFIVFVLIIALQTANTANIQGIKRPDGSFRMWHNLTLTVEGPSSDNLDFNNKKYQLDATFISPTGVIWHTPGFLSRENASVAGKAKDKNWQTLFSADEEGIWNFYLTIVKVKPGQGKRPGLDTAHFETGYFSIGPQNPNTPAARGEILASYDHDELVIEGLDQKNYKIELYDVMGIDVYQGDTSKKNKVKLNKGLYFVEIAAEDFSRVIKLQVP